MILCGVCKEAYFLTSDARDRHQSVCLALTNFYTPQLNLPAVLQDEKLLSSSTAETTKPSHTPIIASTSTSTGSGLLPKKKKNTSSNPLHGEAKRRKLEVAEERDASSKLQPRVKISNPSISRGKKKLPISKLPPQIEAKLKKLELYECKSPNLQQTSTEEPISINQKKKSEPPELQWDLKKAL